MLLECGLTSSINAELTAPFKNLGTLGTSRLLGIRNIATASRLSKALLRIKNSPLSITDEKKIRKK